MRFKDKVILISGAKQGMGLAIAKKLKSEGANLVLNDKIMDNGMPLIWQQQQLMEIIEQNTELTRQYF